MPRKTRNSLWSELQRRQVPKAAAAYAVGAWLLLQVADVTFEPLGVPGWVSRVLVVASILGFPLVVALAWFFDLTIRGVARESADETDAPARPRRARLVIAASVGVALVGLAAYVLSPRLSSSTDESLKTVAVFRFDNLSSDESFDGITVGLGDELRRRLGHIADLRIIARESVQSPILRGLANADVAQRLGATHAVRGSVRRDGDDLVVQVALERMATGEPLWSAQFQRAATQLLELQSLVSEAAGQALVQRLSDEQRARLRDRPTTNEQAWALYQRAVLWMDEWTLQSAESAIAQLEEATQLDPNFALAYSALADAYWGRLEMAQLPASESIPLLQGAIDKALAIDPTLSEAWSNAAALRDVLLWDGASALSMHRRAVALDPNSRIAWLNLAQHYWVYGPYSDEAREAAETFLKVDPVGLVAVGMPALQTMAKYQTYREPRLIDEALESLAAAKKLGPRFWAYAWWECQLLRYKGQTEQAIPFCERAVEWAEGSLEPVPMLAVAYAAASRREDTLAILHNLEKEAEQRYLPPMWFALIHASLGNRDACLDAIDEATRVRDWNRTWFKEPVLDVVRDDPRFQAAFRPLGMPAPVVRQQ